SSDLFLFRAQAPLGIDRELHRDIGAAGGGADDTGGHLHVLFPDGSDDVTGRQAPFGDFFRIQPDSHRVVAGTPQLHLAYAGDAGQPVLDVQDGVVAQIGQVVALVG